jgi:LPXTG-motif cell wall-anchored protein
LGDISIPVAKTASAVVVTTVSKSGVKEVFTKVITRPSQLTSIDQVVIAGSEDTSGSSNNNLFIIIGVLLLLLLVLFIFNKFRTSKNS